jgi:phosphoglycolate phosphatase-like HAD superfamily hydrolase
MEIKIVVSDHSGVISDDRRPVYEANMRILRDYGKPIMSFEEWLPKTRLTVIDFLSDHGIYGDPVHFRSLYKKYFDEAVESGIVPKLYPKVYETFKYLKGRRKSIAILSSHPTENLKKELNGYNLLEFIDLVIGDSDNKTHELRKISDMLNVNAEDMIIVGDTINEIVAGKEVGAKTAAVYSGYHTKERLMGEKPDLLLRGIHRLRYHIK